MLISDISESIQENENTVTDIIKSNKEIYKNTIITNQIQNITYIDIKKNPDILNKYKIIELKSIAKENKLLVGGTKPKLLERLLSHFNRISKTITIQKRWRGYLLRESIRLRGTAFKNRTKCVNSSDFFTLEPILDIDSPCFFSYEDENHFHYGFDIKSIFILLSKTIRSKIMNPYNREKIPNSILEKIDSLGNKIRILYPGILEPINVPPSRNTIVNRPLRAPRNRNPDFINAAASENNYNYDHVRYSHGQSTTTIFNRITTPEIRALEVSRQQTIETRIQELFMEIDQLGNYTQSDWFSSLNLQQYYSLYRLLNNIWRRLSLETRSRICILGDPFINALNRHSSSDELSFERIQEVALRVCENMVYTGIDIEYRKIGALHVLSALTVVSINARLAIPWLYESVL